jgi:hypothetical protein
VVGTIRPAFVSARRPEFGSAQDSIDSLLRDLIIMLAL